MMNAHYKKALYNSTLVTTAIKMAPLVKMAGTSDVTGYVVHSQCIIKGGANPNLQ